jgi:hypothetical protein
MNTIVFVLIVLNSNGHFTNTVIPTMEFLTLEKCQQAIQAFTDDIKGKTGYVNMRCVRIEK